MARGIGRRPPRPRKPSTRYFGQEFYKLRQKPRRLDNLFLNPPMEFASPTTSNGEWWIYLALAFVTGTPEDPTKPPFIGGENWTYQQDIEGGRMFRGGSVVDFVYDERIGLRTQTGFWHLQQGTDVIFSDLARSIRQDTLEQIIDLYDQHYLHDPSGEAACKVVALAIKGIQLPDPYRTGSFIPTYPGIG